MGSTTDAPAAATDAKADTERGAPTGIADVQRDITYGRDPRLKLDLYLPIRPNGAALVAIHGGGWWLGDKTEQADLASSLTAAGYLVAAPNYRLANGAAGLNLYPTQVEDLLGSIAWLRQNGPAFDRSRIGVIGGSSGGNLALEMAIAAGLPAASWSGLIDLAGFVARHGDAQPHKLLIDSPVSGTSVDQGGADPGYYKWLLFNLLGPDLVGLNRATPIGRISSSTGPVLFANSLAELVPPEEALLAAAALTAAGVPSSILLFEGSRHAAAYAADALPETLRFFAHHLAQP
jgi:acetyl esterase/lipase